MGPDLDGAIYGVPCLKARQLNPVNYSDINSLCLRPLGPALAVNDCKDQKHWGVYGIKQN